MLEDYSDPFEFTPHSEKQERAIFSQKRILLLGAGTQWGKTQVGAIRMKMKNHLYTDKEDNFIITSPTYKTMMQSTLPPYLKMMDGYGKFNSTLQCFKIFNGGTVYFRTETDPDSIVGITNVRHIWGDEAGKYRKYFWENLQNRADFRGCGIDLTTSPYALNWVYKEIIKPTREGKRKDVEYIQAASWENPFHSLANPEAKAAKKATMDLRRFEASYGGVFGRMVGLVYDCYDEEQNTIEPFELPSGTKFYAGVDWGYTDPFVIKVRAITPDKRHYGVSEFYRSGLTVAKQKLQARQMMKTFGIERFFCDPSRPDSIAEFQLRDEHGPGLPAVEAENDIRTGIDAHYELLKSRRMKYFKGCNPHTEDEYETYHYPEPTDLKPDQDKEEDLPVDQSNHCFVAGTLIETISGPKPIESIVSGDFVLTRKGFKKVTDSWCEGYKEVIDIGNLICTPEHPVFTTNRGFVRADELTDANGYYTKNECIQNKYLTGKATIFTEAKDIIQEVAAVCILMCGNILTDLFLMGFTSIIKTIIRIITIFPIYKLSIERITKSITEKIQNVKEDREKIFQKRLKQQKNGTPPMLELFGIKIMLAKYLVKKHGLKNLLLENVVTVRKCLKLIFLLSRKENSVPKTVKRNREGVLESITSYGNVKSAGDNFRSINIQESVPVEMHAHKSLGEKRLVYNITVCGEFEFFANGILVLNCMDLERYLSKMLYRPTTSMVRSSPKTPGEQKSMTREERTEWLKTRRSLNQQTESWK